MDNVISILVVAVAIALAAYQNFKKKKTQPQGKRKQVAATSAHVKPEAGLERVEEKKVRSVQYADNKRYTKAKEQERRLEKTPVPDVPIKLKTPEEAKRAFIYSEIFNRKY